MKVFVKRLERLISLNRLEQAVDTLLNTISDFKTEDPSGKEEARQLRNQTITLSQRLYQAGDNLKKGFSTEEDVSRERLSVSTTLLDLLSELDRYPVFVDYIREIEDEEAWKAASRSNTISAYQDYFNNFPDGKYKDQTQDLIIELQEVETRRSEEMKRIAADEKRRRDQQFQQKKDDPVLRGTIESNNIQKATGQRDRAPNQPPRRAYGGSYEANSQEPTQKEHWNTTYLIAVYASTIIIALIGIGVGIYLRVAKKDGVERFDDATRAQGIYMIIWGALVWLITFSMYYG
ncbi:MAG: hypothetical protein KDC34_09350 [Saprospiraceae bacterium]|nr:hypothetical protein [Saprospiraceae bacterium]